MVSVGFGALCAIVTMTTLNAAGVGSPTMSRRIGEVWKEGKRWKVQLPLGIHTTRTKSEAAYWSRQAVAWRIKTDMATDEQIRAIHRNLVDFGYSHLTLEDVKDAVEAIYRGEPKSDIITNFATTMLVEAKLIPDPGIQS